ncbi:MAG: signal peptide peptidase SppA [Porphyromonas sp.]|nr:MAG: signal peptide peptidase SppA [Porphyromonas sp.]
MKSFFKTFLAALLALVAGSGCIMIFFFVGVAGLIGSLSSLGDSNAVPVNIEQHTVLKIDVAQLHDVVSVNPFDSFSSSTATQPVSLSQAIRAIADAKNNPNIEALYLNVEGVEAGMASVDELRLALQDFKASHKPIIAYGDSYSQKAYYLASVANQIYLNPLGSIELIGIASGEMMYKDALDKVGIKMEVFKVGTFKSAVEPYILNKISDANKLQKQEYIDGLWSSILQGVSTERKINADSLNAEVNKGLAFVNSDKYVQTKLVDKLLYRDQIDSVFAAQLKVKKSELKMVNLSALAAQQTDDIEVKDGVVQVIYAEGEITQASISPFAAGASTIGAGLGDKLREAAEDDDVKAVVLRMNSPGGDAFLSEQLWHAVKQLRSKKPVVVSMGDYAASGGYYISSAANRIVAQPNTLTGSIGIFGLFPNFSELVQKVGVNVEVVKTNDFADLTISMPYKPLTNEQRALIQRHVERGYDIFLSRVAEGRHMTKAQVDSVGQGRVWLGRKAQTLGLVDKLGGLDVAIKEAASLAKLSDYSVDYGVTRVNVWEELFKSTSPSNEFIARLRSAFLTDEERKAIRIMQGVTRYSGIQARLPYDFEPY